MFASSSISFLVVRKTKRDKYYSSTLRKWIKQAKTTKTKTKTKTKTVSLHSVTMEDLLIDQLSMLGNTIYSLSYNEETQTLSLFILCWSPSYMRFVLENDDYGFQWVYPMPSGTNVSFIGMEAVYGEECLSIVYSRCFQLFSVSIRINQCNEDTGVSLDNNYLMWLTSMPANDSSDSDIIRWKETIGASKNDTNETIVLFFDLLSFNYFESCESFSMEFTFNHNITFYEDDDFSRTSLITSNNPLFVQNTGTDQRLYVEIDLESSITSDLQEALVIDMSILDVWFCVYDTNDSNITGSCFDSSSASGVELWYLYSNTSSATDDGYMTRDDIISDSNDNLIEQFSFIIPVITNKNANRFGVQIAVELTIEDIDSTTSPTTTTIRRRRRELLAEASTYRYNRMTQTFESGSVTLADTDDDSGGKNGNDQLFGEDALLYYIMFAVCILLVAAVCVIIYLTRAKKKASFAVKQHAQTMQTKATQSVPQASPLSPTVQNPRLESPVVKLNLATTTVELPKTETDTSTNNGVIITKQESIPF